MRDYAGLKTLLLDEIGEYGPVDGHITSDMAAQQVAVLSLAGSFYSKLCPVGNSVDADAAALEKFSRINASISTEPFQFSADNEAESCFYDYFKDNLRVALEPHVFGEAFDLDFIREHMNVGPGAAQKADSRHMVSKLFESPISYVNEDLIPLYRAALVGTGLWCDAERHRNDKFGFTRVRGGKLFFAPKKADISRTCCTEPNLELLFQKACGAFLEQSLARTFGIFLKTQPDYNRELARLGSIDGSFGTIDLVSASDSISLQLCIAALPACPLKTMLLASRCKLAVLPSGEEVELKMISTMGNGFTFPLQTVIFASAVRAVYTLMGFPCVSPRNHFGVFGDDLVVRRETYYFLCRMLTKLGFEVNVGKSFNTGSFRESCGHDYYSGVNVRGVYIRSLETHQEVYSAFNRLARWSANHEVHIPRTLKRLMSWAKNILVPPSEADDAGFCVPWKASRATKVDNRYWFKYRCYRPKAVKLAIAECDAEGVINPFGQAVGRLCGAIRRRDFSLTETSVLAITSNLEAGKPAFESLQPLASVSIRNGTGARTRYKIVSDSLPYWDYWPLSKQASVVPGMYSERVLLTRGSQDSWEAVLMAILPDGG